MDASMDGPETTIPVSKSGSSTFVQLPQNDRRIFVFKISTDIGTEKLN